MHALIENNVITAIRDAPSGGAWEDGQWLDFTDPATLSEWEKRHGWVPVVETPRLDDTDTTKHDEKVVLVDGVPVQQWKSRPWNAAELAARAEQATAEAKAVEDRAILDAIAHTSTSAHADGETWTAFTGAHDAYALGAKVTHKGKTWTSTAAANIWEPGVYGWV